MTSETKDEVYERQLRRLAVMLGEVHALSDLGIIYSVTPVLADADADDFEKGTHLLQDRWESYLQPARRVLAILNAPRTIAEERAAAVRAMDEEMRADANRKRPE